MESYKPFGFFGVAMGYGQGFVTQAALLLDKMRDATTMLQWAAKATYWADFNPYIVPEGCEIDPTGKFWHRTGDLGNGVQQAEIVKALRAVIGIDDSSANLCCVRGCRTGWTSIRVERYPAMIERDGAQVSTNVGYTLRRTADGMRMDISSEKPLPETNVRLGPFANRPEIGSIGRNASYQHAGDSWWVWVGLPKGGGGVRGRGQ